MDIGYFTFSRIKMLLPFHQRLLLQELLQLRTTQSIKVYLQHICQMVITQNCVLTLLISIKNHLTETSTLYKPKIHNNQKKIINIQCGIQESKTIIELHDN